MMFLHGKSLSGDSLEMVLRYGCIDALLRGRRIDAIVAALITRGMSDYQKALKLDPEDYAATQNLRLIERRKAAAGKK